MKTKLMALAAAVAVVFGAWAAPTVTYITAKQRYPWNGLVDITCKVSGIEAETGGYEFAVVAVDKETGKAYTVSNFSVKHGGEDLTGLDIYENGDYSLLWNAREDMGQVVIERMTVRITLEGLAISVGKVQLWEGGPYWADRNIGAKKPEDYGLYFWWGDTKGHRPIGSEFNYKFFDDSDANCPTRKRGIATLLSEGWIVSKGETYVLAPSHDAAHIKWAGAWRMPTKEELYNLYKKCDWSSTTINGVNGFIVRGRGVYISNSIFLPCGGRGYKTSLKDCGWQGTYWSSSPAADDDYGFPTNSAWQISFQHGSNYMDYIWYSAWRFGGLSIRPVQDFSK